MFLHVLEGDERGLFADTAWALIHVDNDVDEREETLLAELQLELGLDSAPPALHSTEELMQRLAQLDSPVVRRVMLLELSGVALADEVLHASERELLREIAETLELAHEAGAFLEYVAEAQTTWRKGRELVTGSAGSQHSA